MTIETTIFYSFLGGLLPALLWLWFFLKEDNKHPEPKWLILAAFLSGMLAVLLALPTEMLAKCLVSATWPQNALLNPFETMAFCKDLSIDQPIFLWAASEELLKYFVAVSIILWRKAVDEPIDVMIYMITVALGFSALETGLFLMGPIGQGKIIYGMLTGNLRFMGAALIHTLSSAIVGFSIAISFYRSYFTQFISLCTGLIIAILLHALFNHNIIVNNGSRIFIVFFLVWIGIIGLLLLFEQVKKINRPILKK